MHESRSLLLSLPAGLDAPLRTADGIPVALLGAPELVGMRDPPMGARAAPPPLALLPPRSRPPRATLGSYSAPSKLASKNFLNHWMNSKLSWKRPLTSLSTGTI